MKLRTVKQIINARAVTEGAGVTVHRTIGTSALKNLDPFLMLDLFGTDNPDEYIAGFPDHPHRGFNTFTYMLEGHMEHRDSMGNQGNLTTGGAQWMRAGSGVIHSEMPKQTSGLMQGFQLWINLPAEKKMSAPAYQDFSADAFPVVDADDSHVKVLSGHFQNIKGPVDDVYTDMQFLDIQVDSDGVFKYELDTAYQAFIYIYNGNASLGDTVLPRHTFAVLGDGEQLEVSAGVDGAQFILVAGKPIGEPVVQYGPFVMNTREEIDQAFADYRDGRLVREKASYSLSG